MILHRSLEDDTVPDLLRCGIVCRVQKRDDKADLNNKRQASLTAVPCKIFVKMLAEAIYTNANGQGLISREQFACRSVHFTTLQLFKTQNDWVILVNDGKPFDCVYFEFEAAFESSTAHIRTCSISIRSLASDEK